MRFQHDGDFSGESDISEDLKNKLVNARKCKSRRNSKNPRKKFVNLGLVLRSRYIAHDLAGNFGDLDKQISDPDKILSLLNKAGHTGEADVFKRWRY